MKLIPLTQGRFAQVDDEDFDFISKMTWHYLKTGYAATFHDKRRYMHRVIMDAKKGQQIDHADRNTLNNKKENLRLCTHSQNMCNRPFYKNKLNKHEYRGIRQKKDGAWSARIKVERKEFHLGIYDNEISAALAYDRGAEKYFGEFAILNLPDRKDIPIKHKKPPPESGYYGVYKKYHKYRVYFHEKGKAKYICSFDNPIDAARKWDQLAIERYGISAPFLNNVGKS